MINRKKNQGRENKQPKTENKRRDFLKMGLLAGGSALAGGLGVKTLQAKGNEPPLCGETEKVLTADGKLLEVEKSHLRNSEPQKALDPGVREGIPGKKFIMVIDLAKCDGCAQCTVGCQKMHYTPPDREWIKVYKMKDSEDTAPYWFPKPCFHCDNPPCTKVCPVNATFKRQDGIVLIDNVRCIGCRFCMAACPYSSRFFNWDRPEKIEELKDVPYSPETSIPRRVGTVEKCDFCPDMARMGKLPDCVTACTMDAIYFGDSNEDAVTNSSGTTAKLSQLLKDNAAYRYLEELGTEPRVFYLPPKNRRFPEPDLKKESNHNHDHNH
ncbi:MAG: 4Fe-4S dicluster domain-containing protein [Calditrichia bacterium]